MSYEERTVEALTKKITLLEARLSSERKLEQDGADNLSTLFSPKGQSLYNYLIGDAYFMLWNLNASSLSVHGDSVGDRCVWALEASVASAATCLDIIDPLRLLCIYSWCNSLIHIRNQYIDARSIADQTFNLASLHTNSITQEAVDLLQRLRDDIMSYQPKGDAIQLKPNAPPLVLSPDLMAKTATRKAPAEDATGGAMTSAGTIGFNGDSVPMHRREIAQCTLSVRRVISIPVPVQLDVVSSASLILKALDKIFRTYVRGTALPGQLSGGNTVEFDGTTLTFRNFILHGPYISWKGFVHFLLDFAIAAPPSQNTRIGRTFLAEVLEGNKARLPGGGEVAAGAGGGANAAAASAGATQAVVEPVTMLEAAVVFIESAKSITPALVLSKFLKLYEEMAREVEGDPWASVHAWAEEPSRRDWDINSGINFMQFVDCLGKLGMVAYKAARYTEMLPTASDKIEHFLSAHLGLTDTRKWQRRVEAKLKKIKSVIKEVGDGASTKRPPSAQGVHK